MSEKRLTQVGHSIRDILSEELAREWDFGSAVVSITHVTVSPDFSTAKVMVSILASERDRGHVWKRLQNGTRVLQRCIGREMRLKKTPLLRLHLDDSIEQGSKILQLIKSLSKEDQHIEVNESGHAGENNDH